MVTKDGEICVSEIVINLFTCIGLHKKNHFIVIDKIRMPLFKNNKALLVFIYLKISHPCVPN